MFTFHVRNCLKLFLQIIRTFKYFKSRAKDIWTDGEKESEIETESGEQIKLELPSTAYKAPPPFGVHWWLWSANSMSDGEMLHDSLHPQLYGTCE